MIKQLRTYKLLTRIVVLVVFMASVLPAVAHACMMADEHDGHLMKKCCCAKSQHSDHDKDTHHDHDMNHDSHEMDEDDRDCDHDSRSTDHHRSSLTGDCCQMSVESASFDVISSRSNKISQEELALNSLVILLHAQHLVDLSAHQKDYGGLQDTGPPIASTLSLHILHARFLN